MVWELFIKWLPKLIQGATLTLELTALSVIAGLIVAIPAVLGYNYLLNQVKVMITELENFASSLADRIELETSVASDSAETAKQ